MSLDPLILSRLQFAWVIAFHIILPAFTVGLASFIAVLECIYFYTDNALYLRISMFWTKIFAVSFGMGVVSGIVLPFQLGTNWSRYADVTANILSPLFAYETLTAFFLESTFLGILLFGRNLIPRWAHVIATLMIALGTLISAFWIIAANSWMQTPAGFYLNNGALYPLSWIDIIFNPSFPYRFSHNVVAFYITTGFVVIAVAAYFLRRHLFVPESRIMLSMTFWLLTLLVPLQMFLGDLHGLNTLKYQPAKIAAIEGHWLTERRAPLILFALPDQKNEENHAVIKVPLLGSLILTHDVNGEVPGLKQWPTDQRAPVTILFFSFRLMVGLGLMMLIVIIVSLWLRLRNRLYDNQHFLLLCQWLAPMGFITVLAGWVTTEVGRQPWTVYHLLRTAHSVTPSLTGLDVVISFIGYLIVYCIIFPVGIFLMIAIVRGGLAQLPYDNVIEGGQPREPITTPPEYKHEY